VSDYQERLDALAAALAKVPGLQVVTDLTGAIRPPAVIVTPPTFTFEAYGPEPTEVTTVLAIVEPVSDRALANLLGWVPLVAEAVHAAADAYVTRAEPSTFSTSGTGPTPLPAYLLEIAL
jgi:hypothetical protein